jgi:hypothetical protein
MEFEGAEFLEAGVYTVEVRTERGTATCTAVLDDGGILHGFQEALEDEPSTAGGQGGAGGEGAQPMFDIYPTCEGPLGDEMWFGMDEDARIDSLGMHASPDSLDLKVSRDDVVVLLTHVEFEYPSEPKDGCDELPCRQAAETVILPQLSLPE